MKTMTTKTILLLAIMCGPRILSAQPSQRPEILVVGTYHMANPGRDVHSMKADDITAPERQRQIAELLAVLERFHPTKIAIESNVGGSRTTREYSDYLAGKYSLNANEIDQIGYRLAKMLGQKTIYPVDEDGDFPFYRVRNYAIANNRKQEFDSVQSAVAARVNDDNRFLLSHTVLQMFERINSDSSVAADVGEYYRGFLPFGEPYEYAGPDLIASWFQRNLRIYRNIRALVTSPTDRILVIYGAGHLGWLRQIISSDQGVALRKLNDYTSPPPSAAR